MIDDAAGVARPPIDLGAVAAWMDREGLPSGPIEQVTRLGGGTQNLLLSFSRGGRRFVLRHPPEHKRPTSDAAMRREIRLLRALEPTGVPHPRLIAGCEDLDVVGSVFYLMAEVDGVNPTVGLTGPYLATPEWRHGLGLSIVEAAASIGAVDHRAIGLADFGRPEGFIARQVERWSSQLASYRALPGYDGPEIPGVEAVAAWLDRNCPPSGEPGLIHGDFHLANIMCSPRRPEVAAVIDWELSTIGDPLLDLGTLLATWPGDDGPIIGGVEVHPWTGFPSSSELVDHYREHTSRDLSWMSWYVVMACFKVGVILEGTYARARAGLAPRETGDLLHRSALRLFARAETEIGAA